MKRIFGLLFVGLLLVTPAAAQKKFVAPITGLHCPPNFCLDAITGAGNDAAAGTEFAPWATLAHADATLATNATNLLIKYPDGQYRRVAPIWHGFLNYYVPLQGNFQGAVATKLYDVYSGQHATTRGAGGFWMNQYTGQKGFGLLYNGFAVGDTIANWANQFGSLPAAGFVAATWNMQNYGIPFSVGTTTTALIEAFAPFQASNIGTAFFDFLNQTTGRISFVPTNTSDVLHIWGFLAGGTYQAIYYDLTKGVSAAANLTFTPDTHKDLVLGAAGVSGATKSPVISYGFMTKLTQLADADYLTLAKWFKAVEIPRVYPRAQAYLAQVMPAAPLLTVPSNGLELTPAMGWDSWRFFGLNASEANTKTAALAMSTNGMAAAGYQYIEPSDNWSTSRGADGHLVVSANYPSGMASLGTYIHSLGLKYGLYLAPGIQGCGNFSGSATFETTDANDLASFGVDRLMYDSCTTWPSANAARFGYQRMGLALQATGRPIEYLTSTPCCSSGSTYGLIANGFFSSTGASGWSNLAGGNEVWSFGDTGGIIWSNEMLVLDGQFGFEVYAGPGHFNMPDFLSVGPNGVNTPTDTESQSFMALWSVLAAPLIVSSDIVNLTANQLAILVNSEVIAVDQDTLGLQGKRYTRVACGSANCETYARQLTGSRWAVVMLNRSTTSQSITSTWTDFGGTGPYTVRDVIAHSNLGSMATAYTTTVPSHGVAMIVLTP